MPIHLRPLRCALLALALIVLAGCATSSQVVVQETPDATRAEQLYRQGELEQAATAFLALADQSRGDAQARYQLRAAEALRDNGDLQGAARVIASVKHQRLHGDESSRLDLLDAQIATANGDPQRALEVLNAADPDLPARLRPRALELRARAETAAGDSFAAAETRVALDPLLQGADQDQNEKQVLELLATLDAAAIKTRAANLQGDDPLVPWLERALRGKGEALPRQLPRPDRMVGTLQPGQDGNIRPEGYQAPRQVALLLPLSDQLASVARSIRDGFFTAYFADGNEQRPQVRVYDSGKTSLEAIAAYQRAVADGADHVVGPLSREGVGALFHEPLPARVLALNHPDSGELPPHGNAEFGLLPESEGAQVAAHMLDRGITRAAIIAADADWAERAARAFTAQFEAGGGSVAGQSALRYDEVNFKTAILQATGSLGDASSAGVFISMRPQQARLLLPQLRLATVTTPVFATSHVYSGDVEPGLDRDLDGVEFCDIPWLLGRVPGRPDRDDIARQLPSATGVGARLFAFGMDAYALLPYLDWLLGHPDAYLDGATGQLSADSFGRIHRSLGWARFDNGMVRPIQGALSEVPATPVP